MGGERMGLDRRTMLAAGSAAAVFAAASPAISAGAKPLQFPKGFRWGTAAAGHQIEGNNTNSDLWFLENIKPTTYAERSGDACDSYHRYQEDVALMAKMGLNAYRFGIEWARIEPSRGFFSNAEIDHYRQVVAACRRHGIAPSITFLHSSTPRWFAELGGWFNPDSPSLFANYCDKAARALAADIDFAFTINEPQVNEVFRNIPGGAAYFTKADAANLAMHEAAAKVLNVPVFQSSGHPDFARQRPNLIAGHEQAVAAIKAARSNLMVGVTLSVTDFQPGSEDSPYLDVRKAAYGEWIEAVRRAGDFTGVQSYRTIRIPGKGKPLPPYPDMPAAFAKKGDPIANMQRPMALGNTVEYIHRETGKPVIMTENGLETENDAFRAWYIPEALKALHGAVAKGVPVLGYYHWSLLDNFEWNRSYGPKFGLIAVDRQTFKRTLKPSAAVYARIARANAV